MRKSIFALIAFTTFGAFGATSAQANGRAVCLHGGMTYGVYDCSYNTIAQCKATASGNNADCDVNPEYIARGFNPADAYAQQYSPAPPRRRVRNYNGY